MSLSVIVVVVGVVVVVVLLLLLLLFCCSCHKKQQLYSFIKLALFVLIKNSVTRFSADLYTI